VLIDATRPGLAGQLLPAGWLREPADALRRADAVVVTRASSVMPALDALILRHYGKPADAWCRHVWGAIDVFDCAPGKAPARRVETGAVLRGQRVVAVAGLGNPQPFMQMLHEAGATICAQHLRADHAAYRAADAARLHQSAREQQAVLATTWKDWTKLSRAILENVREPGALSSSYSSASALVVVVPRVEIEFVTGEPEIREALTRATAPKHG
jgi:tetraacyldisaccharide 4'-kinase